MSEMESSRSATAEITTGREVMNSASPASGLNCRFLGSLTSARGREFLSQLCLKIAQQSNLKHHFVDGKQMEKMNKDIFQTSTFKLDPSCLSVDQNDQSKTFEMKVFYLRDHLEKISDDQVKEKIGF